MGTVRNLSSLKKDPKNRYQLFDIKCQKSVYVASYEINKTIKNFVCDNNIQYL